MTDAFEAIIWTFCLQIVSNKSLRNEIRTQVNHMNKIRAFEAHVEIAYMITWTYANDWSKSKQLQILIKQNK